MRWCLVVLLCLAIAPAAAAEPVALMDAPLASGVALAGAEVVVTHDLPSGAVTVDAVSIHGGAVRRLLSVPPPPDRYGHAVVAASAEQVTVLVTFDEVGGLPRQRRVYSGPPSGPLHLVVSRRAKRGDAWVPVDVDVDGNRMLLTEFRGRPLGLRARVLEPGVAPAPVPGSGSLLGRAALAGDYVAFPADNRGAPATGVDRVLVVDHRTGAVAASLALDPENEDAEELDLAPDGRVVVDVEGKLVTAAPGQVRTALPGAFTTPRFAGDRIGALEPTRFDATRPVVLDGGVPRALGVPSTDLEELTGNAGGFAWIANGCVLYAPVDGAPAAEPPDGPCPRSEVVFEETDQILHGRRVRIAVTCIAAPAPGCRGSVMLRDRRIAGRGRFSVPAGATRVVDVVLTRPAARRVRRVLKREGEAFLLLAADVRDGRVPNLRGSGVVIDR